MSRTNLQRGQASLPNLFYLLVAVFSIGLLFLAGKTIGNRKNSTSQEEGLDPAPPIQISSPGVDAAEPVATAAPDGTFYVAWVNHDATQADVVISRFSGALHKKVALFRPSASEGHDVYSLAR